MTAKYKEFPGRNPGTYFPVSPSSPFDANNFFESDEESPTEMATSVSRDKEASNTAGATDASISGPSRLDRRGSLDVSTST